MSEWQDVPTEPGLYLWKEDSSEVVASLAQIKCQPGGFTYHINGRMTWDFLGGIWQGPLVLASELEQLKRYQRAWEIVAEGRIMPDRIDGEPWGAVEPGSDGYIEPPTFADPVSAVLSAAEVLERKGEQ